MQIKPTWSYHFTANNMGRMGRQRKLDNEGHSDVEEFELPGLIAALQNYLLAS